MRRWNEATAKIAGGIFLAVFYTKPRAPVIYSIRFHQRLVAIDAARHYIGAVAIVMVRLPICLHIAIFQGFATRGAARCNLLEIASAVIGFVIMHIE